MSIIDARNAVDPNKVHGLSPFVDLSEDEFRRRFLGKKTGPTALLQAFRDSGIEVREHKGAENLKLQGTSVDWTGILTTAMKDQGYCGNIIKPKILKSI